MQTPQANNDSKYPVDADTQKIATEAGQLDNMDNPIQDREAQNVTNNEEPLSGAEAEKARQKANAGKQD